MEQSWNYSCFVTWFCYQLKPKPGNTRQLQFCDLILMLYAKLSAPLNGQGLMIPITLFLFILPPASTKLKGGYTGITLSVCPSVHPSVCPSVRLSVCGQNRVPSVSSRILMGSISYLHILSSNFRRCVACNARFTILKIWDFGDFFKFVTLTLSSFDLGSNMTQWYG